MGRRKKLFKMGAVEMAGLVLGWLLRWSAKKAWACRAGLMPIWWTVAFLAVGWVASGWPPFWPVPITVGLAVASVLWFVGEKLSPHAQSMWLWLVPDGLDDGKPGVLDRPTERGYLCLLLLGGGGWLSTRMQYGWTQNVQVGLLTLLALLGVPWWWHRGWRRKRPLNMYVRRWPRVEGNDDLKVWHGSTVAGVTSGPNSTLLTVKLRGGRTVKHVGGDSLILCSQLGLRPGAITVAQDPNSARRVMVRVVPRDPWVAPILHPVPALRSLSLADHPKVLAGKYEDGTDDMFKIGQHALFCGQTGSGKSEYLQAMLAHLLAYNDVAVVCADLASGATFDVWDGVFAAPLATDITSAWALIGQVFALIEHRERRLAARRRAGEQINVLPPTEDEPWVWFILDEFPDLVKAAKLKAAEGNKNFEVITLMERMANKGRKVGVWLWLAAQNPTNDDAGSSILKGALTGTVGLGLNEHQSRNLWQSARAEGWDSAPLTVGTYLCRDREKEHQAPRVAKGLLLTPNMRAELITAAVRQPRMLTGNEAVILGVKDTSPALGDTARRGSYEAIENVDEVADGAPPRLFVVRDPGPVGREPEPVNEGVSRRDVLEDLDEKVLREVAPAHQGSIRPIDIARQLDVDRQKVNRALGRLRRAGLVTSDGNGGWVLA